MDAQGRNSPASALGLLALAIGLMASAGAGAQGLPAAEFWAATESLSAARTAHTATLLGNGKILVAGGIGDSNRRLNSAEVYEPATGTWSLAGSLGEPRCDHTATLFPDGRVLVAGGSNGSIEGLRTAELYDPVQDVWTPTGSLNVGRQRHSAVLLQNGKVLVVAGASRDTISSAELYDPATGAWTLTGRLALGRFAHTTTLLGNGRVLVTGGITGNPTVREMTASVELYDPTSGLWTGVADLPQTVGLHTATLLATGDVLVAGGFTLTGTATLAAAALFNPSTGQWRNSGSLVTERLRHTATLLASGEVLITGGIARGLSIDTQLDTAEIYQSDGDAWRRTMSPLVARNSHTATRLPDGRVLVAGGTELVSDAPGGNSVALDSAELFLPPTAIDASYTGAWFDPTQSGHGILLEVLPDHRVHAQWFTFNPAGDQQAWFGGAGTYSGNVATIANVVLPTGGRWIPNFNPATVVLNQVGTLTLTFSDRDHGRAEFDLGLGFGAGTMNLTRLTALATTTAPATVGTIVAGHSGSWFDPAQGGHGLMLEVLPGNQVFAAWFTYNPAGDQQAWFSGVGTYTGNRATIAAVQPSGGRWIPNFDPTAVVINPWGTLVITIDDCNHGRVDFNSVRGYGIGSMNLTRLTRPDGVSCP